MCDLLGQLHAANFQRFEKVYVTIEWKSVCEWVCVKNMTSSGLSPEGDWW